MFEAQKHVVWPLIWKLKGGHAFLRLFYCEELPVNELLSSLLGNEAGRRMLGNKGWEVKAGEKK